ncbi:MAG: GNAT family N-acetyltransferase [Proteiniphilum sp.]|jgi:predicted acetyltransferase|nr:GNAT family N-acetyltransferase [Proteiniphilum sp.]
MIRFADAATRQQVREMWKTVFDDDDDYMKIYFRRKYRDENTLLYMDGERVAASLQMLPYRFTFCGTEIPVVYLSGVSTLPEYRKRGYMRQLMMRSFEVAVRRDVPLMLLVPQEEGLLGFYERYGFAQAFDAGEAEQPSLRGLTAKYPGDLHAAFREFDGLFRRKDMTVQKSFDDFRAIVEEAALYDFPPVRSLTGMARVINAGRLLSIFAGRYGQQSFSISVHDGLIKGNSVIFRVAVGGGDASAAAPTLAADVGVLAQLLLGYHTSERPEPFNVLFPEKRPQLHFMLE